MSYKRPVPCEKLHLTLGRFRLRRAILRVLEWGLGGTLLFLVPSGCSWSYFYASPPRHQEYAIMPPELKIGKFILFFDGHVKDFENNNSLSVTFSSKPSQGKMKKYFLEELKSAGLLGNATEGGFTLSCNYRDVEGEYFGGGLESFFLGKVRISLKLECCIESLKWCDTLTSAGVSTWPDSSSIIDARARANEGLLRQLVPLLAEQLEKAAAARKSQLSRESVLDKHPVAPVAGELQFVAENQRFRSA